MKLRAVFFLLAMSTLAFGQNAKMYKGKINTLNITFYLRGLAEATNADPVTGTYRYEGQKEYILLNGFRNSSGNLSLVEFSDANFSGTFLGTMSGNKINGRWISANQKKNFSFELTAVTPTKKELAEFENAISAKANEFRNY